MLEDNTNVASTDKVSQIQSDFASKTNKPEIVTDPHQLPFQIQKLMFYHKHKQYNESKLHRVLYPTRDALVVREETLKDSRKNEDVKVIRANGNRSRPSDLQMLSYEEQQEFFKLEAEYEQAFK